MATSRPHPALAYLESAKNLAGCSGGLFGLGLTLTEIAGDYWPLVVAGLYGVGALIAPPERPRQPTFHPTRQRASAELQALREDFASLQLYLAAADLPQPAHTRLRELKDLLTALLTPHDAPPDLLTDPGTLHILSRAVRQDIPESVDSYLRTRWWSRLTSTSNTPEDDLTQQLTLLTQELTTLATAVRQAHEHHQRTLTQYLRNRATPPEDNV